MRSDSMWSDRLPYIQYLDLTAHSTYHLALIRVFCSDVDIMVSFLDAGVTNYTPHRLQINKIDFFRAIGHLLQRWFHTCYDSKYSKIWELRDATSHIFWIPINKLKVVDSVSSETRNSRLISYFFRFEVWAKAYFQMIPSYLILFTSWFIFQPKTRYSVLSISHFKPQNMSPGLLRLMIPPKCYRFPSLLKLRKVYTILSFYKHHPKIKLEIQSQRIRRFSMVPVGIIFGNTCLTHKKKLGNRLWRNPMARQSPH